MLGKDFVHSKKKKRFSTNLLWNNQVNLCRDFSLMYTTSLELTSELIHTIQLNRNLNLVAIQWYWFMTFSLCIRNADHYNYLIRYPISLNPNYLSNAHIRWFLPLFLSLSLVIALSLYSSDFERMTSTINLTSLSFILKFSFNPS